MVQPEGADLLGVEAGTLVRLLDGLKAHGLTDAEREIVAEAI